MLWLSHEKGEGRPSSTKGKKSSSLLGRVEVMWNVFILKGRHELMGRILD